MVASAEPFEAGSEWGIEPVPITHRRLSGLDLAVLWGDLGIGLLVLVTGALLVPGLGFATAMVAIVLGSVIGCAFLAWGGVVGARYGVPTMVLFRSVLGIRGSWVPSALNALQLIGWTAVELWAMSLVADVVARRVFGFSARWLWLASAALLCTALAVWGPVGVTRIWMKRFSAWIITGGLAAAVSAGGTGEWPTFGPALDLVIAMPISWLPLVADYTRFARRPGSAFIGTFTGYLIANVWLYALGAMLVLSAGASPSPRDAAEAILGVSGGLLAGVLFLAGLLAGETDEAFADMYSGALSLRNIFPRASQRALIVVIAAVSVSLAGWVSMDRYEVFLFLIGSLFVPLFGMLAAEYVRTRRRRIDAGSSYPSSSHRATDGVRLAALVPWVAGFLVYHWIVPTGPPFWIEWVRSSLGTPLSETWPWLGASLPAFAVAFALSLALDRRR